MGNDDRWENVPRSGDERTTTEPDDATGSDTTAAVDDSTEVANDTAITAGDDAVPPGTPARTPAEDSGVGRREFVAAGALAAAGAGGWYVFIREDEQSGPLTAVEASWSYWENGNADAYRALHHSESPEREESYWNDASYWAEFGMQEDVEWEIRERTFVERSETEAVIEEVYYWNTQDQDPQRITDRVHLRVEDGEWKLWRIEFISSETVES
jgi:hypothetical protein